MTDTTPDMRHLLPLFSDAPETTAAVFGAAVDDTPRETTQESDEEIVARLFNNEENN